MKKPRSSAWPLALLAVAAGCSDAAPSIQDAAVDVIAADVIAADAGTTDAGTTDVGSTDVGSTDVGTTDVGSPDAGSPDAGTVVFHGCTAFVDRTADGAERTVRFTNFRYDPACMLVAAGQRVTFSGDFAVHQFRPGVAPSRAASDPPAPTNNPMTARDEGTTATFDFPAAGTYPFFCLDHEGTGMYGAIRVR